MNRQTAALLWACGARGLSPVAWKVLVKLSQRVGKKGFDVWPSHKLLASNVEISVSTIKRAIAELVEKQFLTVIATYDARGDRRSNVYRLSVVMDARYSDGHTDSLRPDDEDEDGDCPLVQDEPRVQVRTDPQATGGLTPQATGELAEHIKARTIKEEDSPLPPKGDGREGDANLFGELPASTPLVELAGDLFLNQWKLLAQDFPKVSGIELMSERRTGPLMERLTDRGVTKWADAEFVIMKLFKRIRGSPFLCGEVKDWAITPDWVLGPKNFGKTMERKNERETAGTGSQRDGGRSAVATGLSVLSMLNERRERAGAGSPR